MFTNNPSFIAINANVDLNFNDMQTIAGLTDYFTNPQPAAAAAFAAAPTAISTFDSVHDFKSMTYASPFDYIDPNRGQQLYYTDRLNFNYNRIMCGANINVSIMNSFLYKPALNNIQGYSNNPNPITSKKDVEDFFLYNVMKNVADNFPDTLFIIKNTPKALPNGGGSNMLRAIANKLIEKGWFDTVQLGGQNRNYINLVIDVSPVLRKYYIQNYKDNLLINLAAGPQNASTAFRILIAQEQANDPAGSLGRDYLRQSFGPDNVLIEQQNQIRTYINCDSVFRPRFGGLTRGINGIYPNQVDTNFQTSLYLLHNNAPINIQDNNVINTFLTLNYQSPGGNNSTENPNNRTSIHDTIKKIHAAANAAGGRPQLVANNFLIGADNQAHDQATAFYNNQIVANVPATVRTEVAVAFLRKRLGDRCLLELVRLINSGYNDVAQRIRFEIWQDAVGGAVIPPPESAVFVGEDRMAIALAILLGIPCIYDSRNFTILYAPQRLPVNPANTTFADYPAAAAPAAAPAAGVLPLAGGSKTKSKSKIYKQVGGLPLTRAAYKRALDSVMIDEPYYFFRVLPFIQGFCNNNNLVLDSVTIQIITNTGARYNVISNVSKRYYLTQFNTLIQHINQRIVNNNFEELTTSLDDQEKMYLLRDINQFAPIITDESQTIKSLCLARQHLVNWTFINVYNYYIPPLTFADPSLLLSVTQKMGVVNQYYRKIFFRCPRYTPPHSIAPPAQPDVHIPAHVAADNDADDATAAANAAAIAAAAAAPADAAMDVEEVPADAPAPAAMEEEAEVGGPDPVDDPDDPQNPVPVVAAPGGNNMVSCIITIPSTLWQDIITQRQPQIFFGHIGGGKNENLKYLQTCLGALKMYEIYSIVDERTDADFYDINDSGVRVAFDCLFYIFFDNLVDEYEIETDNVDYELLPYYLFINKKDYYFTFNEIIKFGSDKEIFLDDKILESLKSTRDETTEKTFRYFDDLFERTIEKRDKINTEMYNYFAASEFVNQYRCAVKNNFTHYGFNTIFYKFMNIIQNTNAATAAATAAAATAATATAARGMTNNQQTYDIPRTYDIPQTYNIPQTRAISARGGVKSKKTYKKSIKPKKNKKCNKTKKLKLK